MKVGYARVSKNDGSQNLEAQLKRLREAGCEKLFSDEASGKLASRPGWDECVGVACARATCSFRSSWTGSAAAWPT